MALHTNLCPNPAFMNDATNTYGPDATAVRVTGVTGMPRTEGFGGPAGSGYAFAQCPVTPGLTYRFSAYAKGNGGATPSGTCGINWYVAGAWSSGSSGNGWSVTDGGVVRLDTGAIVAPAGVDHALLVVDNVAAGIIFTAVLYEQSATLSPYGDGASPGGTWSGAAGNSPSTYPDVAVVLPPLPAVVVPVAAMRAANF